MSVVYNAGSFAPKASDGLSSVYLNTAVGIAQPVGADGAVFSVKVFQGGEDEAVTWDSSYYSFVGGSPPELGHSPGDYVLVVFAMVGGQAVELTRRVFTQ